MRSDLDRPVIGITYSDQVLKGFSLWRHMFHGFVAAGATPISIECSYAHERMSELVDRLDGLVISGGGDVDPQLYGGCTSHPTLRGVSTARDRNELNALQSAIDRRIPVLAICRGMQLVNVNFGGTLHADIESSETAGVHHSAPYELLDTFTHDVRITPGSLLSKWMASEGTVEVNSGHHQGIDRLGAGLSIGARASDGLIEGIESPELHLVGIQWHPEILWPTDANSSALLSNFVDESRSSRAEQ